MRRPIRSRVAALIFALLQVLSPAAAVAADARVVAESARADASHVEAHSSVTCPRAHAPDCALCQHVATTGCAAHRVDLPAIRREIEPAAAFPADAPTAAARHDVALPRAPPLS